jgi:GNAT superfamily N-acetyltransferase
MPDLPVQVAHPPEGVSIREATLADAEAMAALRRAMFEEMRADGGVSDPWSDEERRRRIDEATAAFASYAAVALPAGAYLGWLAEADGCVIGSCGLAICSVPPTPGNPSGRSGQLLSVYVDTAWRRRGVARALVTRALAHAQTSGIGLVSLHPTEAGAPLYEQLGFWTSREMRAYLD